MVRRFYALQAVDPGFYPHNVLSMVVSVARHESESNAGPSRGFLSKSSGPDSGRSLM